MNYFVSHSTTYIFVKAIGAQTAQSATVIGVTNVSAALVAVLHCWIASRESLARSRLRFRAETIRNLMVLSSIMGIAGNAIQATAINRKSVGLAIVGRFVMGFSSSEIVQREIIAACLPAHVVYESALLMLSRIGGIACGLFVGSATEAVPIALQRLGVRTLQASNWLMILVWLIHLVRVLVQLRPKPVASASYDTSAANTDQEDAVARASNEGSESESSSSEEIETPSSMLYRKSAGTPVGSIPAAFGGGERLSDDADSLSSDSKEFPQAVRGKMERRQFRQRRVIGRIRKLLAYQIGIPVSLSVFIFSTFGLETFFSATPLITQRYFGWSGARAGTFLGFLAITILPVQYVCAIVARRYEERTVLKVSTYA